MAVWSTTTAVELSKNNRIDSEFFHPNYLASEEKVLDTKECKNLGQLGRFLIGPFGSAFHVSNYDPTSNYRYIRGKDVKPFTLLDDDNVYMPEKDYKRLIKYAVIPGDLLISVVGTLGNVAIVPESIEGIFSCKSTVFRDSIIDPYYLLAYFNSKYGRDCLLRRQRGAIQTGLNKDDLKTVPVPIFQNEEKVIADLIRNSLKLSHKSKTVYTEAQELLEKELGMYSIEWESVNKYEASFSEVVGSGRIDSDYFQPKYKKLDEICKKHKNYKIGQISVPLETGQYASNYSGKGRRYIRGVNIKSDGFIDKVNILNTAAVAINSKTLVEVNDILITRVGSIGNCALVEEDFGGSFYSDNLIRVRLHPNYSDEISPYYLLLLFKGLYGQMQMTRYSRGSVQQRLNQSQLSQINIPIIDVKKQNDIEVLLREYLSLKKESERLLVLAKERVENLIEGVIG